MPDEPLEIIKKMKGVVEAFYLDDNIMNKVMEEEATVKATGGVGVVNEGLNQASKREKIICIVKDPRFRPPPEPTVLLLSNDGKIMGLEVFPGTSKQYQNRDDVVWLSDGFVVFPNVMPGKNGSEAFIMPPIPFPELNESNGCKNVVSCSPAPTCDKMIRESHGMEDDGKLASILVGYDMLN